MQAAREEIGRLEMGMVIEEKLISELSSSRSKYQGGGKWDHSPISSSALEAAVKDGEAYPLISKRGLKLLKQAHLAITLRGLLKADDWKGVVATLGAIGDAALNTMEEAEAAWSEVNDKCAEFETALEGALATGRSRRVADGKAWDHTSLSSKEVTAAAASVRGFPHTTDKGKKLLAQAELVLSIRGALLAGCKWDASASWTPLSKVLHAAPTETKEFVEVAAAWQELGDMRLKTERDVSSALESTRYTRYTRYGRYGRYIRFGRSIRYR